MIIFLANRNGELALYGFTWSHLKLSHILQFYGVGTIIMFILGIKQLRFWKFEYLVQGHTVYKRVVWHLNQPFFDFKAEKFSLAVLVSPLFKYRLLR